VAVSLQSSDHIEEGPKAAKSDVQSGPLGFV
jgi:hypothetical protein